MFGFRSDGTKIKGLDPIDQMIPQIMKTRNDAMNYNTEPIRVENMDNWIIAKRKEGVNFNYMHIVIAGAVRTYALRQKLNRFVVNGRIYQRNGLYMSISTKTALNDDAPELTTKIRFTGRESIYEIKEKVDSALEASFKADRENGSTKTASKITAIPAFLMNLGVGFLKLMDRWGMLPKSIMEVSPFHTSFFLTNLKSIKGDYIFHHLYNFGTTGMFVSMGKEKYAPCVNIEQELEVGKIMNLGITTDERYCDGFYFLKSFRMWKDFLQHPEKLEGILDIPPIESKKETKARLKAEKKATKRKAKADKKETKKLKKHVAKVGGIEMQGPFVRKTIDENEAMVGESDNYKDMDEIISEQNLKPAKAKKLKDKDKNQKGKTKK